MEIDRKKIIEQVDYELDKKIDEVKPKLPKGLRIAIRRLKQNGELDMAEKIRKEAFFKKVSQKREDIARVQLLDTINDLLKGGSPEEQVEREIRAVWLMNAAHIASPNTRVEDLEQIIDNSDTEGLSDFVETNLPKIRDELKKFFPDDKRTRY